MARIHMMIFDRSQVSRVVGLHLTDKEGTTTTMLGPEARAQWLADLERDIATQRDGYWIRLLERVANHDLRTLSTVNEKAQQSVDSIVIKRDALEKQVVLYRKALEDIRDYAPGVSLSGTGFTMRQFALKALHEGREKP